MCVTSFMNAPANTCDQSTFIGTLIKACLDNKFKIDHCSFLRASCRHIYFSTCRYKNQSRRLLIGVPRGAPVSDSDFKRMIRITYSVTSHTNNFNNKMVPGTVPFQWVKLISKINISVGSEK